MTTETLGSRLDRIMHEVALGRESTAEDDKERRKIRKQRREDIEKHALTSLEYHRETDPNMLARAAVVYGSSLKDATRSVEFVHSGQKVKIAFARYGNWESKPTNWDSYTHTNLCIIAYPEGVEKAVRLFDMGRSTDGYGVKETVVRDHLGIISDGNLATMREVARQLHQALETGQTQIEL